MLPTEEGVGQEVFPWVRLYEWLFSRILALCAFPFHYGKWSFLLYVQSSGAFLVGLLSYMISPRIEPFSEPSTRYIQELMSSDIDLIYENHGSTPW